MQFFDVKSECGTWSGIDLSNVTPLFCIKVAENRLKPLFVEKVTPDRVKPNRRPMPMQMIDYRFGAEGNHKADLIELSDRYSNIGGRVIKSDLTVNKDLNVIYSHEYVGMVGDPEKLRKRLLMFFDTGVNWDDSKSFIFKGINPPPASTESR